MKKQLTVILLSALLLSGCASGRSSIIAFAIETAGKICPPVPPPLIIILSSFSILILFSIRCSTFFVHHSPFITYRLSISCSSSNLASLFRICAVGSAAVCASELAAASASNCSWICASCAFCSSRWAVYRLTLNIIPI